MSHATALIDEFLRSYLEKCQSYNLDAHQRIIDALSQCRKQILHEYRSRDEDNDESQTMYHALTINGNEANHFSNRIQDVSLFPLAEIIEKYPSLIHALDLRYQGLSNTSMEALNKVITTTELYYLNLKGNNIRSIKKLLGIDSTSSTNWSQSKLKVLDISENPVEDIMALADELEHNTTIASLNVSSTDSLKTNELIKFAIQLRTHPLKVFRANCPPLQKLSNEVIAHFAEMLRLNHTLRILELSRCGLTCHDVQLLIQHGILLNNRKSSLRVLNVSGNRIGCDGALWIGRWLQNNRCELQQLNLSYNRIGLVGGSHLADALAENHTLKSLDLSHCPLGDNALHEIACALSEANTTLQYISLKGCKFDQRSMKSFYELQHVIRRNYGASPDQGAVPSLHLDLIACKSPNTRGVDVYYMAERNQAPTTDQPSFLGAQNHPVLDSPNILDLLHEYELFDENENEYLNEIHRHDDEEPGAEDYGEEYYGEEVGGEDYNEEEEKRYQQQYEQQYGQEEVYGEDHYDDLQGDQYQGQHPNYEDEGEYAGDEYDDGYDLREDY